MKLPKLIGVTSVTFPKIRVRGPVLNIVQHSGAPTAMQIKEWAKRLKQMRFPCHHLYNRQVEVVALDISQGMLTVALVTLSPSVPSMSLSHFVFSTSFCLVLSISQLCHRSLTATIRF